MARTVMAEVPFEGQSQVLVDSTEVVDWPVGWLDGETPILDQVCKSCDQHSLGVPVTGWLATHRHRRTCSQGSPSLCCSHAWPGLQKERVTGEDE